MTDYTQPLLLGYARRDLFLSDQHVDRVRRYLKKFASVEGFTMGLVYVESLACRPAAFDALVEAVKRDEITAVVIPDWRHLALIDDPAAVRYQFERTTGARFLLYDPAPDLTR